MKQSFKIFFALLAVAVGFSSCLKDDHIIHPSMTQNIIEFYNNTPITSGTSSLYAVYTPTTLEVVPEVEFDVVVSYSGADVAPQDITVEIAAAPNAVSEYNAKHGSAYNALTPGTYTLPTSVVIPKGERRATVKVKVNPDKFDQSKSNVLALSIKSASIGTISGNFGTVIFNLPVKSFWEGVYKVHEKISGATVADFEEVDVKLTTVGPNTLTTQYVGQWFSGSTTYKFNNDGTISVSAVSGSALSVTVLDSHYDAATKSFYVKWSISAGPRTFEETWTSQ